MKISIITVCHNSQNTIEETINSVINQSAQHQIEYIIIDGASTDRTINIIKEYQKSYSINLVSEPDEGIYDAMNKGVKIAKGEWIIFLNSDDYFFNQDVIKNIMLKLDSSSADIIYGSTEFRYKHFKQIRNPKPLNTIWKKMPFNHQSCLVKRKLLLDHPFDTKYQLAADYEFIVYHYKSGTSFNKIDTIISSFYGHGASDKQQKKLIKEYKNVLKKYYKNTLKLKIFFKIIIIKPFIKKLLPWRFRKKFIK